MKKPDKDTCGFFFSREPRFKDPNESSAALNTFLKWIDKIIPVELLGFLASFLFFLFLSAIFLAIAAGIVKRHPNWSLFFGFLSVLSAFCSLSPIFVFLSDPRGFKKIVENATKETIEK